MTQRDELYEKLESCKIKAGDVLISLVGTYGKIAIVPEEHEPGIINPRLMKISFDNKIINPVYFKYLFNGYYMTRQLGKLSHGGTMDILNVGIIKIIKIPTPPIDLQTQFAQIVYKVEALKAHYQASLNELANLYGSLSQRAFKGELDLSKVAIKITPKSIESAEKVGIPTITHKSRPATKKLKTGIMATTTRKLYEDLSKLIKESFGHFDFRFEDIKTFLEDNRKKDSIVYKYFTSEEQKRSKTDQEPDIKDFIFDCIEGNNDHLMIEQFYYNALNDPELSKIRLKSGREEALLRIQEGRLKHEDISGIYFRVIK